MRGRLLASAIVMAVSAGTVTAVEPADAHLQLKQVVLSEALSHLPETLKPGKGLLVSPAFVAALRQAFSNKTGTVLIPAQAFERDKRFRLNYANGLGDSGGMHPWMFGSNPAKPNEFPDTVALLNDVGDTFCSGLVIDAFRVLTAGHCVDEARVVVQGTAVDVDAKKATIDKTRKHNTLDIGLLYLATSLTSNASPVFASATDVDDASKTTFLTASGFGATETTSGGFRQFAEMTLLSRSCSSSSDQSTYGCKA